MLNLRSSILTSRPGNLNTAERWASMLAGLGLTAAAVSRGGLLRRGALSAAGLLLMSRGTAGYCGMKAAVAGQAPLGEGLREQWQRTRARLGAGAGGIRSLRDLYVQELQELYSGELQAWSLLLELPRFLQSADLQHRVRGYASEVRTRNEDLGRLLGAQGEDPREHRDSAMQALTGETHKMMQIPSGSVRDAAVVASLQRILHYRIAAYGSAAAYASVLGRSEEASRLAQYSDRDKTLDRELTELATQLLNQRAGAGAQAHAGADEARGGGAEARAH